MFTGGGSLGAYEAGAYKSASRLSWFWIFQIAVGIICLVQTTREVVMGYKITQ